MFKLCRSAILFAMLTFGAVPASAQTADQQANMDILKKEISCLIINEYVIRQFNLFASQLDMISDENAERRRIVIPIMAMSLLIKADADRRITELVNSGMDNAVIEAEIDEITNGIYEKYSRSYIASTDYDKATEFIKGLSADQDSCEAWFTETLGGMPVQKPEDRQKGGVDG